MTGQISFHHSFCIHQINSRIHNYKCPLCSAVYELMNVCEDHVTREHPSWKNDLAGKLVDIGLNVEIKIIVLSI